MSEQTDAVCSASPLTNNFHIIFYIELVFLLAGCESPPFYFNGESISEPFNSPIVPIFAQDLSSVGTTSRSRLLRRKRKKR